MNKNKGETGRIMIAAASSGSGKTLVTCALLQLLKDKGYDPVSFKCGPDYIDPMFHRTVLGIDSQNLDTFLAGEDNVRAIVEEKLDEDDGHFAVIEGVMGIYDGIHPDSIKGSCYEIAQLTDTPIMLIVNCSGTGRTVISLIKGILADDTSKLIKGIILNRMSDMFCEKLKPALKAELSVIRDDITIVGNIPATDLVNFESRHLGLKLPGEISDLRDQIRSFSKLVERSCDIETIISIMTDVLAPDSAISQQKTWSALLLDEVPDESSNVTRGNERKRLLRESAEPGHAIRQIAVARDEAFCFYYPENIAVLESLGFKITYFSPLHDDKLPEDTDAILLGGGYPELYLPELSSNTSMLGSIRSAIEGGTPSLAECGGFMYLHKSIEDREGREYGMVGIVDGKSSYSGHLVNFGYTMIKQVKPAVSDDFREAFTGMRGHEFRYFESSADGRDVTLCKPSSNKEYESMYAGSSHLWGWPHLYYPSGGNIEKLNNILRK